MRLPGRAPLVKRRAGSFRRFAREHLLPGFVWRGLRRLLEGAPTEPSPADALEAKLWRGFSGQALSDLESLRRQPASSPGDVAAAERVLACWYSSRDQHRQALEHAVAMRKISEGSRHLGLQALLEANSLMELGDSTAARRILSDAIARKPSSGLYLAMANTYASPSDASGNREDEARLHWLNEIYRAHRLAPLAKANASKPLTLDNLTAPSAARVDSQKAKISVLVAAYRASTTLALALDSLLGQTWGNLEIIVIDDNSDDGTFEVAEAYAHRDPRVIALEQDSNRGAYPARNLGLEHATGEFVTVHDSDDWSHPQKLETQVRDAAKHPERLGNLSAWARCLPHLYFRGRARASLPWIHHNYSSLLVRRELLKSLGGWDDVRVGSDAELLRRLRHGQTSERIPCLLRGAPLAFALSQPTSLTRGSITHANTVLYGVRRTYYEASLHWLEAQPPGPVPLPRDGQLRAFPAPDVILPEKPPPRSLDAVFIFDFNARGLDDPDDPLTLLRASLAKGRRVGVFHWPRYESDPTQRLRGDILALARSDELYVLSAGERVRADEVVVGDPLLLRQAIDPPPEIDCARVAVLERVEGRAPDLDLKRHAEEVVNRVFGKTPTWVSSLTAEG